jgi:hypothetical protein
MSIVPTAPTLADGDRLERVDELPGDLVEVVEDRHGPGSRGRPALSPIESSQACIGATISCRFARMFGSVATNWLIELDSACGDHEDQEDQRRHDRRVDEDRREPRAADAGWRRRSR